jgi:hypothetical protein
LEYSAVKNVKLLEITGKSLEIRLKVDEKNTIGWRKTSPPLFMQFECF